MTYKQAEVENLIKAGLSGASTRGGTGFKVNIPTEQGIQEVPVEVANVMMLGEIARHLNVVANVLVNQWSGKTAEDVEREHDEAEAARLEAEKMEGYEGEGFEYAETTDAEPETS